MKIKYELTGDVVEIEVPDDIVGKVIQLTRISIAATCEVQCQDGMILRSD